MRRRVGDVFSSVVSASSVADGGHCSGVFVLVKDCLWWCLRAGVIGRPGRVDHRMLVVGSGEGPGGGINSKRSPVRAAASIAGRGSALRADRNAVSGAIRCSCSAWW